MNTIPKIGYTINQSAEMLGVGRTTLYKEIKNGHLKIIKLGRRTIVPADSIKKLLETSAQ